MLNGLSYVIKIWTDRSSVLSQSTRLTDGRTEEEREFSSLEKKTKFIKDGYTGRRRSCTYKTAIIHHFVRFVMYCFITTALYWARSDDAVHYKSDETVNFCGFRCATTSPGYNRFYKRLLTFINW